MEEPLHCPACHDRQLSQQQLSSRGPNTLASSGARHTRGAHMYMQAKAHKNTSKSILKVFLGEGETGWKLNPLRMAIHRNAVGIYC